MTEDTNANDQRDVELATEIEADRVADAVGGEVGDNVLPRSWPSKDGDVIVVTVPTGMDDEPNPFNKGSVINEVYQSAASVELKSTADGKGYVEFEVQG